MIVSAIGARPNFIKLARAHAKNVRKDGILLQGDFITGLPEETKETIEETRKCINEIQPDLSVQIVIPTFNSELTIEMCLDSVLNQSTKKWTLLIVDKHSTDRTILICEDFQLQMQLIGKKMEIVSSDSNRSRTYNYALEHSNSSYFAFVDSDCVLPRHWLETLLSEIKEKDVGGVGGFYRTPKGIGLWASMVGFELQTRKKKMKKGEISRLPTGCLLIKREALENVPFDSELDTAQETDWGYRLANSGYKILYVPEADVWHHHRNSVWKFFKQQFEYGYRIPNFYFKDKKAIVGDQITSIWMNIQPIFMAIGFFLPPVLLGLLTYWCFLSFYNYLKTKQRLAFGLIFVYGIRCFAWTMGGISKLLVMGLELLGFGALIKRKAI